MTRIEAIRKRLNRATPGPWLLMGYRRVLADHGAIVVANDTIECDADLISHAPQDLRDLLDGADSLRKVLRLVDSCVDLLGHHDFKTLDEAHAVFARLGQEVAE